jgi:FKBP-type peptidyl-prolyl cis-trans isomerase SlyD
LEIAPNAVVAIHYRLTNERGEELDHSAGREPLSYLHGGGELIDGLEESLTGRQAGEAFTVTIPPEKSYGDEDPALIRTMRRDEFPGIDMRAGMQLQGKDPDGNFRLLRVVEVNGDSVVINMNHPLAGETLVFEVIIASVRPATREEIDAGQAL